MRHRGRPGAGAVSGARGGTIAIVVEDMYIETMVLADEARSYFDGYGRAEQAVLPAAMQAAFGVEALKVTTRLMHVLSWLIAMRSAGGPSADLGESPPTDPDLLNGFPEDAVRIIGESVDLYRRAARVAAMIMTGPAPNAPRELIDRLNRAFRR